MSFIQKVLSLSRNYHSVNYSISSIGATYRSSLELFLRLQNNTTPLKSCVAGIHSTQPRHDLMEFFDDTKNWKEKEVRHGRGWTKDDLRLKSNSDLHKLWYVLLKERNMLLTMEEECNEKIELFPSPERLDKVEESMENLETVVRERNRAYHMLERGVDGERPRRDEVNQIGLPFVYEESEYPVGEPPKHDPLIQFSWRGHAVRKFLSLLREKEYNEKRKEKNRNRNEVVHLLRRFPLLSRELLKKKFPDVDIAKIDRTDKARGHHAAWKIEEDKRLAKKA